MAVDYFTEEEKKEQGAQGGPQQGQLGQSSSIVTGNTPAASGGKGEGTSSGQFTNLNAYLDANSGQNFGTQVAGRVEGLVNSARSAQDEAQSGFTSAADQGTVKANDNILGQVKSDPVALAGSDEQLKQFQTMRDAQYSGPKSFAESEGYSPTWQKTQDASSTAAQTQTEGGRKAYLQQQYGAGAGRYDYTPGQQKLDSLLIQNDPNSRQAFDAVRQKGQELGSNFQNLSSALDSYASNAGQQTAAARSAARSAVDIDDAGNLKGDSQINQIRGAAQQAAEQENQKATQQYQAFMGGLQNGNAGQDMLSKYGLQAGTQTWGLDPTKYVNRGVDATAQTIDTPEQAAKVAALSKLAGIDNTFLNPGLAGSYDPSKGVTFDNQRFAGDLAAGAARYQDTLNTTAAPMRQWASEGGIGGWSEKVGKLSDALKATPGLQQDVDSMKAAGYYPQIYQGTQSYIDRINALLAQAQEGAGYNKRLG